MIARIFDIITNAENHYYFHFATPFILLLLNYLVYYFFILNKNVPYFKSTPERI